MHLDVNPLRRHRLAAALVAAAIVGGGVVAAVTMGGEDSAPISRPAATATPIRPSPSMAKEVGKPRHLTITAIGVDAAVNPVGTTSTGAQDVPRSIDATGWWRDGVQPGHRGNAVIVGHTASRADGVFDNLGKLRIGDAVTLRSAGGTLTFAVTRVRDVKVADFPKVSPLVYREGGRPGLVLMTCGDWNGKHYESTTIAFATLATH